MNAEGSTAACDVGGLVLDRAIGIVEHALRPEPMAVRYVK
jgi:hypothetical protein